MMFASSPKAQYQAYRSEVDTAIARVLDSGNYIMGAEVKAFEKEFATHIGLKHAIGVGSGTDALTLALMVLDIGVGMGGTLGRCSTRSTFDRRYCPDCRRSGRPISPG